MDDAARMDPEALRAELEHLRTEVEALRREARPLSRRALFAAGTVAGLSAVTGTARAAGGDPIRSQLTTTCSGPTTLVTTKDTLGFVSQVGPYRGFLNAAVVGTNGEFGGRGVMGQADTGEGVIGRSNYSTGVAGHGAQFGVTGKAASIGGAAVLGEGMNCGVRGTASVAGGAAVEAEGKDLGVLATGSDIGVKGTSSAGTGVQGEGPSQGVLGTSKDGCGAVGRSQENSGVLGESASASELYSGVTGSHSGAGNGVGGFSALGNGVSGATAGPGAGVYGEDVTEGEGIGVWAKNAGGVALKVSGRLDLDRSGVIFVPAGTDRVTKRVALTGGSMIFATLQDDRAGLYVRAATRHVADGSFTIILNKAAPSSTRVAWLILD